jgi:mannose-6-phosphate isomerase-like protein (cupin superfamily)
MEPNITPSVVSTQRPVGYYRWGNNCEAWSLLENKDLVVKVEKMPPGSEEVLHYHRHSQQFFYIINGRAIMEIDEVVLILHAGDGIQIQPGRTHRIMNKEAEGLLEFLVCSHPSTTDDRHALV